MCVYVKQEMGNNRRGVFGRNNKETEDEMRQGPEENSRSMLGNGTFGIRI